MFENIDWRTQVHKLDSNHSHLSNFEYWVLRATLIKELVYSEYPVCSECGVSQLSHGQTCEDSFDDLMSYAEVKLKDLGRPDGLVFEEDI